MGPSTQNLTALPDADKLKAHCQSLAMLDAIISPEWESRYYSFNDHWGKNISLASMRDGSGDDYFILFASEGIVIKGFAHESVMSPYRDQPPLLWPGILESLPKTLKTHLSDPAFSIEDVTFCIWYTGQNGAWEIGNISFPARTDADGSEDLLVLLDSNPKSYQSWAEEYYEREIALSAVEHVYNHKPLTNIVIKSLNAGTTLEDLAADIKEIGYAN